MDHSETLPASIASLFWDCEEGAVQWEEHRDFVLARVLARGSFDDVLWVRRAAGDDEIRRWLRVTSGRDLTPPQLRFWQLVLDLSEDEVGLWLADPSRQVWDRR